MANFNDQLLRMKSLMTYGAVNEKKETNSGAMEYHAVGADGKSYGIIRENQKFYIKVAPKSKEMVVEAYEYIGGFNNKKANEYTNYSNAMKNFELKLMSINEAYNPKVNIDSLEAFEANGEVMTEGTKEMMAEIARQRQIMNNVAAILNESSTISSKNIGTPEAPKTAKFNDKIGKPFDVTAKAELDGDFKKTSASPEKQGEPFGDSAKAEKETDAEYVPSGSVANQKPKGGKVVKVDESTKKVWEMMAKLDKSFVLNESCDEWGSCGIPSSEGVGSADGHLMEGDDIAGLPDEEPMTGFADDSFEGEESAEESPELDDEMTDDEFEADFGDEEDFDMEGDDEFGDDEFDMEGENEFGDDEFDAEGEDEFGDDEFDAEEDMDMDVDGDGEIGGDAEIDELRAEIEALRAEIASLKGEGSEVPEEGEGFYDEEMGMDDEAEFDEEMPEDEFGGEEGMEGDDEFDAEEEMPEDDIEEEFNPEMDANYDDFDESELDQFDDEGEFGMEGDDEFGDEEMPEDEFGISESRKKELLPIVESLVKSIKGQRLAEEGTKLNDFGKHPGYRKKPMSLPKTGSDNEKSMKDWNDESVYSEQPFGNKIGDSAPFDIVQKVTDSVMEALKGKKKI